MSKSESKTTAGTSDNNALVRALFGIFGYLLFWGWNLWFVSWLWLGLGPFVMWPMFVAVGSGMVPLPFALCGLLLIATPALGLVAGLLPRWRTDPGRLLSLFYGVQAPVMLLLAVRMFAVQQLTWPTGLLLAMTLIGGLSLVRTLWSGPREQTSVRQAIRLAAQTGYLLVGLWFTLVTVLYGISLSAGIVSVLPDLFRNVFEAGSMILVMSTWFVLAVFTAVMLAAFPFAMLGISARSFDLVMRASMERLGRVPSIAVASLTAASWILGFVLSSNQPQDNAFAWVNSAVDDPSRLEALEHREEIRQGLVFARLSSERTFDSDPEGEHMGFLWKPLVGETLATVPLSAWRILFWPFVYHPVHKGFDWSNRGFGQQSRDVAAASFVYAAVFDSPIEVAERETLVAAARQTWNWEDAQAGLLEVGQRKVHLDRQDLVVEPHGDTARVFIHDVYRNRTWDDQEVLVYFSLPESAAVTGLWLGPDEQHRFSYVVAPRGAAQEVYERQVQIRRDPALLEQTGPVQYRLRAFPIPARQGQVDDVWSITAEGPEMHVWMELVVPVREDQEGSPFFPMPRANEVRNLYWDANTRRTVNGESASAEDWLIASVQAPGSARRAHTVQIGDLQISAEPARPVVPRPFEHLAVLVDGTYSMDAHRVEIARAIEELQGISDELSVWCTVEQVLAPCPNFDATSALFWGSVALETQLVALAPILQDNDALVVLTDEGSYTLAAAAERQGLPDVELPETWLVHHGGVFPNALPDWTADRISRSGGGVVSSIDELVVRHADPNCSEGWCWRVTSVDGHASPAAEDPFVAIAARRLVAELDKEQRSSGVSALDKLHAVAVQHHVVTPYSSMLVLVDDLQREELKQAESRGDRFDREITDGQETTVSAAPEPASWILLGLGGTLLVALRLRKT